jgi:transketolase
MQMREVFFELLNEAMKNDKRICVLDADLAKANGTIQLREIYPDRAIDVGIAEQNMASVAAGMSAYGLIPFITTFGSFASRRICDQITLSCAYAQQNVKIVGTDPGLTAQLNGGTHMSIEDVGVLRSIPGIVIFEPCDEIELRKAFPHVVKHEGVVYLRMFRLDTPKIYQDDYEFNLFKADVLKNGSDVTIFATGALMINQALQAARLLEIDGINAEVINVHTIKPIDKETIIESLRKTRVGVTCENHNILGGLYSAICEITASEFPVLINAIGIKDRFGEVGLLQPLLEKFEMTTKQIIEAVNNVVNRKKELRIG